MRMRIYAYKLRMRWTLISERYCMKDAGIFLGSQKKNQRDIFGLRKKD